MEHVGVKLQIDRAVNSWIVQVFYASHPVDLWSYAAAKSSCIISWKEYIEHRGDKKTDIQR
jgi:hypothetical protein